MEERFLATPTSEEDAILIHESIIRGHHVYKDIWSPTMGEILEVQREPENEHDLRAVCLLRLGTVVGHVQFSGVALPLSLFRSVRGKNRLRSTSSSSHRENLPAPDYTSNTLLDRVV